MRIMKKLKKTKREPTSKNVLESVNVFGVGSFLLKYFYLTLFSCNDQVSKCVLIPTPMGLKSIWMPDSWLAPPKTL